MSTHLSYSERVFIERSLSHDKSFAQIARDLQRSPSTIAREVLKYRAFVNSECFRSSNSCIYYNTCVKHRLCHTRPSYFCPDRCKFCSEIDCTTICHNFVSKHCDLLDKPPYVCTSCPGLHTCKKNHAYYTATRANHLAAKTLSISRSGFHTSPEEFERIGAIIKPLLARGQSLNHIYATHKDELGISIRTLYNYIDSGVMSVRNIDLPKKVVYRNRRKKRVLTRMEYRYRQGRSFADFQAFIECNPDTTYVEMDTVKSARGCYKTLLTFILPESEFFLAFLMPHAGEKDVLNIFDYLTRQLGANTFSKIFPVILTDNGVEFKNPDALEFTENGVRRTRIFYCDPMSPRQKPRIEKAHVLLRRIIPKKTTFKDLTNEDVHLMLCHLNSYHKESISNQTPFDLMKGKNNKKLLDVLKLSPVPPDEVNLNPALIKK